MDLNMTDPRVQRVIEALNGVPASNNKLSFWVMKIAGPYLQEYNKYRNKYGYMKICEHPEVASELVFMATKKFDLDAVTIFSDILVIPQALGMTVSMGSDTGCVLADPLTYENVYKLTRYKYMDKLKALTQHIAVTRRKLNNVAVLSGYCESPYSLLCYMIDGVISEDSSKSNDWITNYPRVTYRLLNFISDVIVDYLVLQVEAGVQMLQIFDWNPGYLGKPFYIQYCLQFIKKIIDSVTVKLIRRNLLPVPMILYTRNATFCLDEQMSLGFDVISTDWSNESCSTRKFLRSNCVLMENIDPGSLGISPQQLLDAFVYILQGFPPKKYIVNFGYGMFILEQRTVECAHSIIASMPGRLM